MGREPRSLPPPWVSHKTLLVLRQSNHVGQGEVSFFRAPSMIMCHRTPFCFRFVFLCPGANFPVEFFDGKDSLLCYALSGHRAEFVFRRCYASFRVWACSGCRIIPDTIVPVYAVAALGPT